MSENIDKLLVRIPFDGFYESVINEYIDNVIDLFFISDSAEIVIYDDLEIDYKAIYNKLAKAYVSAYCAYFNAQENFAGCNIKFEFESLRSPAEYNFETDKIFCHVSFDDIKTIWRRTNEQKLRATIKELFTDRSGFYSFYSSSLDDWLELSKYSLRAWDYNQLYALLIAACADTSAQDLIDFDDSFLETIDHVVLNHVAIKQVSRLVSPNCPAC